MEDYKLLKVEGFDKSGEPEIKIFKDKHIEVMFNFMPPMNGNDEQVEDPYFDDFEKVLANTIGVEVSNYDKNALPI